MTEAEQPNRQDQDRRFFRLNTDGGIIAAKGQAEGEAAIGVVLRNPDGSVLHELSTRIGWATDHHVAEYRALITGLGLARGHGIDDLRVFMDSTVVVKHINGEAKIGARYSEFWREATTLLGAFRNVKVGWVSRKLNAEADALANQALRPMKT